MVSALSIAVTGGLRFGAAWLLTGSVWLAIGLHWALNPASSWGFGDPFYTEAEPVLDGRLSGPEL